MNDQARGETDRQTFSCAASYGDGGMGRHLAQLVEEARAQASLETFYAAVVRPGDAAGQPINMSRFARLATLPPLRFDNGWQAYLGNDTFDRMVAARLENAPKTFVGFQGQALRSMQRVRSQNENARLELVAAGTHVSHVARQQERAWKRHPLERGWLNGALRRKILREYELADVIQVSSEHAYGTFRDEGIPSQRLRRVELVTPVRFVPDTALRPQDGVFRVVFTGSLSVMKGIPVLLEAFARLTQEAELMLVGGWSSRGMRRYLQAWQARDPRIRIAPGDPLPHLQRADVYAHPSWDDGWGYAPMEALACGIPVIVTEDTGMKERVQEGVNGYVTPTGDVRALWERLEQARHRLSAQTLPTPALPNEPGGQPGASFLETTR